MLLGCDPCAGQDADRDNVFGILRKCGAKGQEANQQADKEVFLGHAVICDDLVAKAKSQSVDLPILRCVGTHGLASRCVARHYHNTASQKV